MKKTSLALSFAAALFALPALDSAAAWVPVTCGERATELSAVRKRAGHTGDFRSAWLSYEKEVRAAALGDPKYVPHPYPQSPRQVFEDFHHAFTTRLFRNPEGMSEPYRTDAEIMNSDGFRYEVVRVENWEPSRCRTDHPAPFYHLVRLYDGDGREFARAALHESGIFAMYARLDGDQGPLDELTKLTSTVRQRFGVEMKTSRAQYVTVSGGVVSCRPVMPCVAFESSGKTIIVNHDVFLFEIEPDAPALGVLELAQRPVDPQALSVNRGRENIPWITVGYGFRQGRLLAVGPRGKGRR